MKDTIEIIKDTILEQTEILEMTAIENECVQLGQVGVLEFQINDMFTSTIEESKFKNDEVKIFPNPTNQKVQLDIKSSNYNLTIFDGKGIPVALFKNQKHSSSLDFKNFNPGIYFVKINDRTNNTITAYKIVKN